MPEAMNWDDDLIQFSRLLCEITAALDESQMKSLIKDLSSSMDLSHDDVNALFDRAEKTWEGIKTKAGCTAIDTVKLMGCSLENLERLGRLERYKNMTPEEIEKLDWEVEEEDPR